MKYLPAGVLYHVASIKPVKGSIDSDVIQTIKDQIKRSGRLLMDESVLRAMEPELAKKFIPVDEKAPFLAPEDAQTDFERQLQEVDDVVVGIVSEMQKGEVIAKPFEKSGQDPCAFCDYAAVCRAKKSGAKGLQPDSIVKNIPSDSHQE